MGSHQFDKNIQSLQTAWHAVEAQSYKYILHALNRSERTYGAKLHKQNQTSHSFKHNPVSRQGQENRETKA